VQAQRIRRLGRLAIKIRDERKGRFDRVKKDIEHRRTVAPMKFDGFASMAAEIGRIGA